MVDAAARQDGAAEASQEPEDGAMLPPDLQAALLALVKSAVERGIDEETWLDVARATFREAVEGQ
jgi:hypothetical protein